LKTSALYTPQLASNQGSQIDQASKIEHSMVPSETPALLLQAEKVLPSIIRPHLIACCPTMDLVAVVTQEEQLDVYRFGGQRAFGLKRRSPGASIDTICWKFNGISNF